MLCIYVAMIIYSINSSLIFELIASKNVQLCFAELLITC